MCTYLFKSIYEQVSNTNTVLLVAAYNVVEIYEHLWEKYCLHFKNLVFTPVVIRRMQQRKHERR